MQLDSLDARIASIRYHKPSRYTQTPYLIAQTSTGATVKGSMLQPIEGENYRFWGEWKADESGKYPEPAFHFEQYEVIIDQSEAGVAQYLSTYVNGLGPVKSRALVEAFGSDTLNTLRSKAEMALQVPGITEKNVASIYNHFSEETQFDPVAYAKLIDMFKDHKVPKSVVLRLLRIYESVAPAMVLKNPYLMLALPRMGWVTVDSWAMAVAKYDPKGIDRHMAAIGEALTKLALDGHTRGNRHEIESITFGMIGSRPIEDAWRAIVEAKAVVVEPDDGPAGNIYAMAYIAEAEAEIAWRLGRLAATARPLPIDDPIDTAGLNEEQTEAVRLIEEHGVVILAGPPGTGKSYTIARVLRSLVAQGMWKIRVAAPTGKAAKRCEELIAAALAELDVEDEDEVEIETEDETDADADSDADADEPTPAEIPCTTIHRLLGPKPNDTAPRGVPKSDAKFGRGREEFSFSRNESMPIETELVIIDETSMVDVMLGASLLRAISPGTRVVFVGDQHQLPSVGPGAMLRDMISAGVPTANLTKIVRSDGGGRVVRACHAIIRGAMPSPAARIEQPSENWVHIEVANPLDIAKQIVALHESVGRNGKLCPMWDMQVVTPQKSRLPIACDNLNRMLSNALNYAKTKYDRSELIGSSSIDEDGEETGPPFAIGDKVVRTKNGMCELMEEVTQKERREKERKAAESYSGNELDFWDWNHKTYQLKEAVIVNGDMGEVFDIVYEDKKVYVVLLLQTPVRFCRLDYSDCHLTQAYALTAHKAQGSGFKYVIVPVHNSFYWDHKNNKGLFSREWIYTAISRAEDILVTVGEMSAIRAAVGRPTIHQRRTRLVERIRERDAKRLADEARRAKEVTQKERRPAGIAGPMPPDVAKAVARLFAPAVPMASAPQSGRSA